jgi:hypothetical protein
VIVTEDDIRKLGWGKDYKDFQGKFDALKRKISMVPDVQHGLRTLRRAKADPDVVLEALTWLVWDPSMSWWRKQLRWYKNQLVAVCGRVRSAREGVEKVSEKLEYSPMFWLAVVNPSVRSTYFKEKSLIPSQMLRQMRAYEDYLRSISEFFGEILRKQPQLIRNERIGHIAAYIRHTTGKNYNEELARLFTDAHEAAGIRRKCFTADQIKKFRQRHLKHAPLFDTSSDSFWSSLIAAFGNHLSPDKQP